METVAQVDWLTWKPDQIATLLFIIQDNRVLLIKKKRGLGAGKINAPGGKLEANESIETCAMRELQEEVCLTVDKVQWCGENLFQFTNGHSMHVHVFKSFDYQGIEAETDEAIPIWTSLDCIPFDLMWEDDHLWIPHMLNNQYFSGYYILEEDTLLDSKIILLNAPKR
ncbi:MAG: 8-oxo-dGTP diphosphatase [Endozoicomonadaceae bacterium]|nr:8-oxo-dGTP diphosphatase [Endozoicomonadaceae bacterium]MBE8233491.1 8-oxo-dGTP diphosphatase [Endozoicomonadaceae bacterium]